MIPIAIVGVGKIARDQHIPTIAASDDFTLAGVVSSHASNLDVPVFATLPELKAALPEVQAVSVCTPPIGRYALIAQAFDLGLNVMIEKPPAATLSEAERFAGLAASAQRTLFITWHSRAAAGVEPARAWLADKTIKNVRIRWLEDVRMWHPGQEWIWEPGIGVFDPGINALSILTHIMPRPVTINRSILDFPANRAAPIAATLTLCDQDSVSVDAHFSFDQRGPQTWTIECETDAGPLTLSEGGSVLTINDRAHLLSGPSEYAELYRQFARLVSTRRIDADLTPFRLVADAFLVAERHMVDPFSW
jgi:D-galactose 1-dehydrogenase